MNKVPMTKLGFETLRSELERLKSQERPKIIKAIAEARAHGDLRENAEYHAAKEQQGFLEGRINDIERKLSHSHVIDISVITNEGKVIFGATVTLSNLEDESEISYQIVGEDEADLKLRKISINSPIARVLIGKYQGDEIEVKTPQSQTNYEIIKVDYI